MLRLISAVFLLAFSAGCVSAPLKTDSFIPDKIQPSSDMGLTGVYRMLGIIDKELAKGGEVWLSISVGVLIDPKYRDGGNDESQLKVYSSSALYSGVRDYFRDDKKFHLIDTEALSDMSKSTHLLTMNVFYSDDGIWSGKLIDLKSRDTIGEYYCLSSGDSKALCN